MSRPWTRYCKHVRAQYTRASIHIHAEPHTHTHTHTHKHTHTHTGQNKDKLIVAYHIAHIHTQYTRASIHIHAEQGQAGSGISHCGMVRAVQDDLASCKSSSPMCTILATPQAYMYYPIYQLPQLPSSSPTCAIFTTNYPAALYVLSSLHLVEDVAKSQKGVAFLPKLNCLITKLTKLN